MGLYELRPAHLRFSSGRCGPKEVAFLQSVLEPREPVEQLEGRLLDVLRDGVVRQHVGAQCRGSQGSSPNRVKAPHRLAKMARIRKVTVGFDSKAANSKLRLTGTQNLG